MPSQRLAILGVGLLGGSVGLAAKAASNSYQVVGYGHREATLRAAIEVGAIDEAKSSSAAAVEGADLVVLCTPVSLFGALLTQIAGALKPGAVVTDVGSTKRSVVKLAAETLPYSVHFVGSHPMAGSEKRGVEFARADLFAGALCILTPAPATDAQAMNKVEAFWKLLGMRLTRLSPDDHDRLLADVSHLPHAVAAAMVAMQEEAGLNLTGKGFLDTTRVAGGDGALWRDILLDNRDNLKGSLLRLRKQMDELIAKLDANDGEALRHWLDAAAQRREKLLQAKLREINPD